MNCAKYYLSSPGSDRDERMQMRFQNANMSVVRVRYYPGSCMKGHLTMLSRYLVESAAPFCLCMEDDVFLHRDTDKLLPSLTQEMIRLDLDVLLVGYLLDAHPKDCHWLHEIKNAQPFKYYSVHKELWGTQAYIVGRAYAQYLVLKYTTTYEDNLKKFPMLAPFSADHIITKRGHAALIFPMLCVEEGEVNSNHAGQVALHRNTTAIHLDKSVYL